jgi:hypothetical protein
MGSIKALGGISIIIILINLSLSFLFLILIFCDFFFILLLRMHIILEIIQMLRRLLLKMWSKAKTNVRSKWNLLAYEWCLWWHCIKVLMRIMWIYLFIWLVIFLILLVYLTLLISMLIDITRIFKHVVKSGKVIAWCKTGV